MDQKELLPPLTPEQVENLIQFIRVNYDEGSLDMDYCCAEYGVGDGFNMALNVIKKGYGLIPEVDEDTDEEDEEDE
jgi:hypothetical protein